MIITFTRSGGFTGIPLKKTIDTNTLEPEKAKKIEELVSASSFFALEASPTKPSPDRFTYTISIEHATLSRNLSIDEKSLTPEMRELIMNLQTV